MSNEDPTLPRLISPQTDEVTALQIKKSRQATESRMRLAGAPNINVTIENLTNLVNDSDSALMTIRREGESMQDIMARVDADDYATDRERSLVNASRSSRKSLENEQATKQRMAADWQNEAIDNDVVEPKHAYETAMSTEINRVARRWDIPRIAAKDLVENDIAVRGQAVVLPIYHRIYSRFAAKYPAQAAEAEAGE